MDSSKRLSSRRPADVSLAVAGVARGPYELAKHRGGVSPVQPAQGQQDAQGGRHAPREEASAPEVDAVAARPDHQAGPGSRGVAGLDQLDSTDLWGATFSG